MKITELQAGVKLIESDIHRDERGWFQENYRFGQWTPLIDDAMVEQINLSFNHKGALRGLHLQIERPQGKLLRCLTGSIRDVVVDVRPDSPTSGLVQSVVLTPEKGEAMWVPAGFAHGFLALEENTLVQYLMSSTFHAESSVTLRWDAPELAIDWGLDEVGGREKLVISSKDKNGMEYEELKKILKERWKRERIGTAG